MGNCQCQTSAAAVVIHHPGNKIQTLFWSIKADEVMNLNSGHYVALVVTSPEAKSENGTPLKYLKLLRPDDMLLVGHVYRLVSFEDVLKKFTAKKTVRLGKLMKEREEDGVEMKKKDSTEQDSNQNSKPENSSVMEQEEENLERNGEEIFGRRSIYRGRQWRPSLQSIAEARG